MGARRASPRPDYDVLWTNHAVVILDHEADEGGLESTDGQLLEEGRGFNG
jgi:hypothetical protein